MTDLNDEQLAAIGSKAKTTVVPAGPGSGKSRTLVGRVKYQLAAGMEPKDIVILTFTNAGAHVFAERLAPIRVNYMGTVHGYCMRLIQTYGHFIGYRPHCVSIVTEEAKKLLLEQSRDRLGRKITNKELAANQTPYAKLIWQDYRHGLKRANMVDYAQILVDGLELLRVEEVRRHIAIRELLGDELQDSGMADWDIIWSIPAETRFLVGDDSQSIYGFRGAAPEIFIHAATLSAQDLSQPGKGSIELVSGGMEYPLTLNYRSDIAICAAANRLIGHNLNRIDKPIVPVSERPGRVQVTGYAHEGEEIFGTWAKICEMTQHPSWVPDEFDQIAILARTNTLVEKYRETLRGLGLPIKRLGGVRLPADWSYALTCISLLIDPANNIHAEEILRQLGCSNIDYLRLQAARESKSLSEAAELITGDYIRGTPHNSRDLTNDLATLVTFGVSSESTNLIAQRVKVLPNENPTLSDLLADLWRNDTWNVEDPGAGVTVCTMHAAKGKEWDVVFVVAMEEGILPHGSERLIVIETGHCAILAEELEEERRLAFVAITRARHLLFLSHSAKRTLWYKEHEQQPSRFIKEMGL